jgi:hypothetical protein
VAFVYGIMDRSRVFELQIRKQPAVQPAAVKTVADDSGGLLAGASLDSGDEQGGKSRIINLSAVKSAPLISFDPEVVWTAEGLPWGIVAGARHRFTIEFSEPCVPDTTLDVTYDSGGAGAASTTEEIQAPVATLDISASGRITAASATRSPLRKAATSIAVAVGPGSSINRYGVRKFVLQNDYIYSSMSLFGLAKSLVSRFGQPKAFLQGARCLALWDLELFDRIRVRDSILGVDADFVVVGFSHGFRSQLTSFDAVEA